MIVHQQQGGFSQGPFRPEAVINVDGRAIADMFECDVIYLNNQFRIYKTLFRKLRDILIFRVGGGFVSRGRDVRGLGFVGWCGVSWSFVLGLLVGWSNVCRSNVDGSFVFRSLVSRGRVSGSLVLGLDVLGVLGLSFVFHISVVTVFVGLVGDDLGAAIGKSNAVRSGDDVVIGFLRVEEIVVRFLILDVVFETVRLRGLFKMMQIRLMLVVMIEIISFTHISNFLVFSFVFGSVRLGSLKCYPIKIEADISSEYWLIIVKIKLA